MDTQRKNIYKQIGAKVAYYRKLLGMSQEELAAKINVHRSVINRIESGTYHDSLPLGKLLDIADALEVRPTVFLKFSKHERKLWNRRCATNDETEIDS